MLWLVPTRQTGTKTTPPLATGPPGSRHSSAVMEQLTAAQVWSTGLVFLVLRLAGAQLPKCTMSTSTSMSVSVSFFFSPLRRLPSRHQPHHTQSKLLPLPPPSHTTFFSIFAIRLPNIPLPEHHTVLTRRTSLFVSSCALPRFRIRRATSAGFPRPWFRFPSLLASSCSGHGCHNRRARHHGPHLLRRSRGPGMWTAPLSGFNFTHKRVSFQIFGMC